MLNELVRIGEFFCLCKDNNYVNAKSLFFSASKISFDDSCFVNIDSQSIHYFLLAAHSPIAIASHTTGMCNILCLTYKLFLTLTI